METSCAPSENVQNPLAVLECLCDQLRFPITRAREYILVYREGQDLGPPGSEDLQELLPSGDRETLDLGDLGPHLKTTNQDDLTSCLPDRDTAILCDQLRFPITRAREYILRYREDEVRELRRPGSRDPNRHTRWESMSPLVANASR